MIIRKNVLMAQQNITRRVSFSALACSLALVAVAGCSSINSVMESDRLDYKSATKDTKAGLEVPPDLTQLQRDNRYAIPDSSRGTATASGYSLEQGGRPDAAATTAIAPKAGDNMRVKRDGNQRWLVVNQTPEVLCPQIKSFWQDGGFVISTEMPAAGVMETDWAENRAKIPQDLIRRTLGKVLDSLYSTGERDKFRTRLERSADGSTEIYISHRGAQEVLTGAQKETSMWTPRPSDPDLEAEFLSRLMARLGSDKEAAKTAVANATPQESHAKLVKDAGGARLDVDESFDRAWRRVGLALDRVGFTVEDRDRILGTYFVRYVDQDAQANTSKGFLSRLFTSSDDTKDAPRYRISVKAAGASSQVIVLDKDGKVETSTTADKILSLLNEQLK